MRSTTFAGLTKFGDLKASLDRLLILFGVVVYLAASGAFQFDEVVLGHSLEIIVEPPRGFEPRTFTLQKCCSTS